MRGIAIAIGRWVDGGGMMTTIVSVWVSAIQELSGGDGHEEEENGNLEKEQKFRE